jgi:hypothetical protein
MVDNRKIDENFKLTFTIFLVLLTGMILVFALSLWIVQSDDFLPDTDLDNVFQFAVPLAGIIIMFISRFIYRKQLAGVDKNSDLISKIIFYRTYKIISFALIEGAGFLALISFMITANYLYVFVFLFMLGFQFMLRPSREGFISDFDLSPEEENLVRKRSGRQGI